MAKPSITFRNTKGSALTYTELDQNFTNLKDATVTLQAGTGGTDVVSDLNGKITLVAGTGVTLTGDNTAKTVTINSSLNSLNTSPIVIGTGSGEAVLASNGAHAVSIRPDSGNDTAFVRVNADPNGTVDIACGGAQSVNLAYGASNQSTKINQLASIVDNIETINWTSGTITPNSLYQTHVIDLGTTSASSLTVTVDLANLRSDYGQRHKLLVKLLQTNASFSTLTINFYDGATALTLPGGGTAQFSTAFSVRAIPITVYPGTQYQTDNGTVITANRWWQIDHGDMNFTSDSLYYT